MKNPFQKLSTDDVLCQLGLERRRSRLARTMPWLAGIGIGALTGMSLLAVARTERGQKLRKDVSERVNRAATRAKQAAQATASSARDAVHASA